MPQPRGEQLRSKRLAVDAQRRTPEPDSGPQTSPQLDKHVRHSLNRSLGLFEQELPCSLSAEHARIQVKGCKMVARTRTDGHVVREVVFQIARTSPVPRCKFGYIK